MWDGCMPTRPPSRCMGSTTRTRSTCQRHWRPQRGSPQRRTRRGSVRTRERADAGTADAGTADAGTADAGTGDGVEEGAPTVIEVTYGYSRDHREDLKQWMLALVTSGEGIPQFL